MFYVYMLRSMKNEDLTYIGYTGRDILTRIQEHNTKRGGKFTNKGRPWKLCCYVVLESRNQAVRFEREMKFQQNKRGSFVHRETRRKYLGFAGRMRKISEMCTANGLNLITA